MTNYEQLKKKICEALPRLMELKFGCKFKILDEYIPIKELQGKTLICINSPKDGIISFEEVKYTYIDTFVNARQWYFESKRILTEEQSIYNLFDQYNYCQYESKSEDFIEVLGIEPTLSDFLQFLQIIVDNSLIFNDLLKEIIEEWDLSKPLLKEQSQNFINSTLALIEDFEQSPNHS